MRTARAARSVADVPTPRDLAPNLYDRANDFPRRTTRKTTPSTKSLSELVRDAVSRKEARTNARRNYLGLLTPSHGRFTIWETGTGRTLIEVSNDFRQAMLLYGFEERSAATSRQNATYEARDEGQAEIARLLSTSTRLPIPALVGVDRGRKIQIVIHRPELERFQDALGLSGDPGSQIVGIEMAGARAESLGPWLWPLPPESRSRSDPPAPPYLLWKADRRRFVFADDPDNTFANRLSRIGFQPIRGAARTYIGSSPAGARQRTDLADPELKQTIAELYARWPFNFDEMDADRFAEASEQISGTQRDANIGRAQPRAARPIDYDETTAWFFTSSASAALRFGLNDVPKDVAATIACQKQPTGRPAPLWGFQEGSRALDMRDSLTADAEVELICRMLEAAGKHEAVPECYPLPPAIGLSYDAFQIPGIRHALALPTPFVNDDMGTGKSFQGAAIADATRHENNGRPTNILVVCPADQLDNWTLTSIRVPGKPFRIVRLDNPRETSGLGHQDLIAHIPKDTLDPRTTHHGTEIALVVSYESAIAIPHLAGLDWDLALLDEAHQLKTEGSARNIAILGGHDEDPRISARRLVFLTGTDITNTVRDLHPSLSAAIVRSTPGQTIANFRLPSLARFDELFGAPAEDAKGHDDRLATMERRLDRLARALDGRLRIRRLKEHVYRDLIPKRRKSWPIDPPDAAAAAAAAAADEDRLSGLVRLLEPGPERTTAQRSLRERRMQTARAKIPTIVKALGLVCRPSDPVLLYTFHTAIADELHAACMRAGIDAAIAHGKNTSPGQRARMGRAFNNGQWSVFIATIDAFNAGHNIVRARHVWFAELDHKARLVEQAEDRAWRRGQLRNVRVRYFHIPGTYDSRIARNIVRKTHVADIAGGDDRRRLQYARPGTTSA